MKETLDFIIIGAQKAGTTSLFEYLRPHPELWLPPGKEAPYFSHDAVIERGWQDYMEKAFAFGDPARKWGTVTPSYMVGGVYNTALLPWKVLILTTSAPFRFGYATRCPTYVWWLSCVIPSSVLALITAWRL